MSNDELYSIFCGFILGMATLAWIIGSIDTWIRHRDDKLRVEKQKKEIAKAKQRLEDEQRFNELTKEAGWNGHNS